MNKENSKIFDIYHVIMELSKTNPIFHNEQGFQVWFDRHCRNLIFLN